MPGTPEYPQPGTAPAPQPPVSVGEGDERRGGAPEPPDFSGRYASPDWRRERTTEDDPRKGRW